MISSCRLIAVHIQKTPSSLLPRSCPRSALPCMTWPSCGVGGTGMHRRSKRWAIAIGSSDAVARSACSDVERAHSLVRHRDPASLVGHWVDIDGFNVLISAEGLLGGAYLFVRRDRAYRDVRSNAGHVSHCGRN